MLNDRDRGNGEHWAGMEQDGASNVEQVPGATVPFSDRKSTGFLAYDIRICFIWCTSLLNWSWPVNRSVLQKWPVTESWPVKLTVKTLLKIIKEAQCNASYWSTYLQLSFLEFHLYDLNCDDYLEIRDGSSEESPFIGKFCGKNFPASIQSTQGQIWIR